MSSSDDPEHALKQLRPLLALHPREPRLHAGIAQEYERLGRFKDAAPHVCFLIEQQPASDEALYARASRALQHAGEFARALQVVERGLACYPTSEALLKGKPMVLSLLMRFDEAQAAFAELAQNIPDSASYAQAMGGFLRLLTSHLQEGYEGYAQRPERTKPAARFSRHYPLWQGEPLSGKKLLLWGEQGVGDIIMFAGFIPCLLEQKVRLTLLVTPKLAPIFAASFQEVEVFSSFAFENEEALGGRYDFHLPMGDLMQRLLKLYVPSQHPPFLKADAARAQALRRDYLARAAAKGRTRLIGLSWHTTNPKMGFTRNLGLAELKPVFSVPDAQFISLQYGNHDCEIAAINRLLPDILLTDPAIDAFNDIPALAAQITAMDQVITIDNMTVHLAGALGVPTTLLVPALPDWRWGLSGETCPWYASVCLLRQEKLLDWQALIKQLRRQLMA